MEIIIRAGAGKWLTDGKSYGKTISLAEGVSVENYYEITDAEYEEIEKANMLDIEAHETL